ncbi:hypothetical protein LTR37_003707 [Vermiconidia calcicola]|uniref:Uncharacterized protein n=1 Tax=Vermiconidia calcicola TaxID=1690605 RepID=A0ACC3NPB8_9PEZI|nr:hypothetical protein LTR37_003707 [Vermiconidia calcicola]
MEDCYKILRDLTASSKSATSQPSDPRISAQAPKKFGVRRSSRHGSETFGAFYFDQSYGNHTSRLLRILLHPILPSVPDVMTTRWPSGYLFAGSRTTLYQHASSRIIFPSRILQTREYAQKPSKKTAAPALPQPDHVKSALMIVEAKAKHDAVNPPRSTLPPPLTLPERGSETVFIYYFRIGRAYGTFYKNGVKAVWYNYKAAKLLKERMTNELGAKDVTDAVLKSLIFRSDFQVLARNDHDIGKLPFFGLLVLVFGEWLPLFVPFMPNAVPGTCRIPKQVEGMREKAQERRRMSFRQGITEPSNEQLPESDQTGNGTSSWPVAFNPDHRSAMLKNLRDDQLHHLSSSLGLHSRLWDRIQLPPPSSLLRRAINKRLQYISQDDLLLLRDGSAHHLSPDELHIACEERGLDVMGKKEEVIRENLSWWLQRQGEDGGMGRALMAMLFRRPNVWENITISGRSKKDK